MRKLILVLTLVLPAAACATTRAQVVPEEHPALEVPPVPPRQINPVPVDPPPIPAVAEMPSGLPTAPSPKPRPNIREPNRVDPKTEASPPEIPDPADPAPPPVPPLRQGTVDPNELERQIRATLDRAIKLLEGVNPDTLNEERRANLENAKSYIKQAENELKQKNLTTAKSLADRAEKIGMLLTGGEDS